MKPDRILATVHFTTTEALAELDRLKFAVSAIVQQTAPGSYEREMAENASRGIDYRIDYLHDSLRRLL